MLGGQKYGGYRGFGERAFFLTVWGNGHRQECLVQLGGMVIKAKEQNSSVGARHRNMHWGGAARMQQTGLIVVQTAAAEKVAFWWRRGGTVRILPRGTVVGRQPSASLHQTTI